MAISYPVGVPVNLEQGSLSLSPVVSILRSSVDIGKPMTRVQFTGELFNVNWRILMKGSELAILYNWYSENLDKNLEFDFYDPISGVLKQYSFIIPPEGSHVGGEYFITSFKLRTIDGYVASIPAVEEVMEWITGEDVEWVSGEVAGWKI